MFPFRSALAACWKGCIACLTIIYNTTVTFGSLSTRVVQFLPEQDFPTCDMTFNLRQCSNLQPEHGILQMLNVTEHLGILCLGLCFVLIKHALVCCFHLSHGSTWQSLVLLLQLLTRSSAVTQTAFEVPLPCFCICCELLSGQQRPTVVSALPRASVAPPLLAVLLDSSAA